jgi:hypothetical protein
MADILDGILTGAESPILLKLMEAVAAKAAETAAEKVVNNTFGLLGVDLDDADSVRLLREGFTDARNRWEARRQRADAIRHNFIHYIFAAFVSVGVMTWGVMTHAKN